MRKGQLSLSSDWLVMGDDEDDVGLFFRGMQHVPTDRHLISQKMDLVVVEAFNASAWW